MIIVRKRHVNQSIQSQKKVNFSSNLICRQIAEEVESAKFQT